MMQKENVVLNSGIITVINDALEQYFEKELIDLEQSLKSGVAGSIGGMISSEMVAQNNHQNIFLKLFTNPKNIFLMEGFVRQNQSLDPQEKKDLLDFLMGYRTGLPN